jgi:hypothetical protein
MNFPGKLLANCAVSLLCWTLSIPAVMVSTVPAVAVVAKDLGAHASVAGTLLVACVGLLGVVAWGSLLVMNLAWLMNRRLARWVPVFGTVAALVLLVPVVVMSAGAALFLAAPGLLLAVVVAPFHYHRAEPAAG